jgi:hypothetical protein
VNSATWININSFSSLYQLGGLVCNTTYEWQVQSICLNSAGTTTLSVWSPLAFFTTAACTGNNCIAPSGLTSVNITTNSAVLSWTAVAPAPVSYNLRYRVISTPTWITINNVTSPYQLGNIGCNAHYEWQVQSVCAGAGGTTSVSPWSATAFFNTLPCLTPCPAPANLSTTNITAFSALASWNPVPGASMYTLRYRALGSLAWMYINAPSNTATITNLACGITYQWQVRAVCGLASNVSLNQFSVVATFTTLPCNTTCLPPTGLTTSNITPGSAQLSWNTTGAPIYRVRYRMASSGMLWIYQNTPATSLPVNGLQPASLYEWQVKSLCSSGSNTSGSAWSQFSTFQTPPLPANLCSTPTGLTATAVSQQGALLTWNAVAGAVSYNIRYRLLNNNTPYTSASSVGTSLQIGNLTSGFAYEWQVQAVCINSGSGVTSVSTWSAISVFTTPLFLTVYPNPANEVVYISLFTDESSVISYELRDLFGKIVYEGSVVSVSGMNDISIETGSIHEGWYSLTVYTSKRTSSSRILISH